MDRFFGLDKVSAHPDNFELLTTTYDQIHLSIIEGILKGAKIPYFTKYRGTGAVVSVIAGFSVFGTDIFVLKSDYETALALITPPENTDEDAESADDTEEEQ